MLNTPRNLADLFARIALDTLIDMCGADRDLAFAKHLKIGAVVGHTIQAHTGHAGRDKRKQPPRLPGWMVAPAAVAGRRTAQAVIGRAVGPSVPG